jgi:hypothetical protein
MEKNDKEQIAHLRKFAPKFFRTLKEIDGKESIYKVKIEFTSYVELICLISDLLKLCITEEHFEAEGASPYIKENPNIQGILELVLQLIPMYEAELLDEIRPLLSQKKLNSDKYIKDEK